MRAKFPFLHNILDTLKSLHKLIQTQVSNEKAPPNRKLRLRDALRGTTLVFAGPSLGQPYCVRPSRRYAHTIMDVYH